jgi:tetratricopeptide (TPR) repeat protein
MAASSQTVPPRVFISYTHDTTQHEAHMWDLSEQLRQDGVECHIDQEEQSPVGGWPSWCSEQIEKADFVLVVCTETYGQRYRGEGTEGKGRGGNWEGLLIRQSIYDVRGKNSKFVPVIVSSSDTEHIPKELRGPTHYDVSRDDGYDDLFRLITGQPERRPSEVAREVRRMATVVQKQPPKREPTPGKQLFTVPFPPNPFFTGREDALDGLKTTLEANGIAAVTGLGGMGKTQTAAQYAHQHRKDYPWVLWVRAESKETLFADLAQLAGRLELPEREAREQSVIVDAMQRWLDEQPRWLLVLDNVEDYGAVRELARKASGNGHHVIITTQQQALGQIGRQRLAPMERDLGAELLLKRAGRPAAEDATEQTAGPSTPRSPAVRTTEFARDDSSSFLAADAKEAAVAREIAQEVGGLPLALDQAGAYIEEAGCGLDDYLALLRQRFDELARRRGGLDSDHKSVAATFEMSFENLAKQDPAAAELLQAAAFLPPDAIPEEIFTEGAGEFGPALEAAASDSLKWNDAIGAAFKFSLLERNPEKKLLAVHRMVQAVVKSRMSAEQRKQQAERVVRAVNAAFPQVEFAVWDKCERLTPSAQACAALVAEHRVTSREAARLLNEAATYFYHRARYAEAEPLYRRALKIDEKAYGPDHSDVAIGLNNLAALLKATNRTAEAEPLYRRALEIDEKAYGPDHPDVAIDLNNLAQLLQATNRLAEAEPLMWRALAIDEKALGPEHPKVAIRLNNLAQLLQATNRRGEAEPLMRRALEIDEKAYGPGHPAVATDLNNLAELLRATNRLDEAEPLHRRALAIDEKAYGPEHPDVARDLNNLALLLEDTNRLGEAEPLMRRALAIFEKSLGPEHPNTILVRENLAGLLRKSSG